MGEGTVTITGHFKAPVLRAGDLPAALRRFEAGVLHGDYQRRVALTQVLGDGSTVEHEPQAEFSALDTVCATGGLLPYRAYVAWDERDGGPVLRLSIDGTAGSAGEVVVVVVAKTAESAREALEGLRGGLGLEEVRSTRSAERSPPRDPSKPAGTAGTPDHGGPRGEGGPVKVSGFGFSIEGPVRVVLGLVAAGALIALLNRGCAPALPRRDLCAFGRIVACVPAGACPQGQGLGFEFDAKRPEESCRDACNAKAAQGAFERCDMEWPTPGSASLCSPLHR